MAKHARPKGQDSDKLIGLRKMAAALRKDYKDGKIDETSFKKLAESYNNDIAYEEKNSARGM